MSEVSLSELQKQAQSLPQRIVEAVLSGDSKQLAKLNAERQGLPAQTLAAELQQLQDTMRELRDDVEAGKAKVKAKGAVVIDLKAQRKELDQKITMAERESGLAQNELNYSKEQLRGLERRVEEIAGEQLALAQSLARPATGQVWRPRP